METVYVSLCSHVDDALKNNGTAVQKVEESLLQLALRMCRKHGIVKDRITLLSPADYLQVVQICYAPVQKKRGKLVAAEGTEVVATAQTILANKLRSTVEEAHKLCQSTAFVSSTEKTQGSCPAPRQNYADNVNKTPVRSSQKSSTILIHEDSKEDADDLTSQTQEEYKQFLQNSNHVDAVDVLRLFLMEMLNAQSELRAELASLDVEVSGVPVDPLQNTIIHLGLKNIKKAAEDGDGKTNQLNSSDCNLQTFPLDVTPAKYIRFSGKESERVPDSIEVDGQDICDGDDIADGNSKELVQELFRSYLNLLVNTRSEIAFTHIYNTPDRGLDHKAFTCLKHQAQKKKMSLYQMAMSMITQLRLGGQGYAPDPNSGLLDYVKGLGLLTDLMNKLQQILEETECIRSGVTRVVGVIRKNLVCCKSQRFQREMVEEVAKDLQNALEETLNDLQHSSSLISPDKPASQGGSLTSRRPRKVLMHYLDNQAACAWSSGGSGHLLWLTDIPFGPHTPSRFPCVLTQFRSPVVTCSPSNSKVQKKETQQQKKRPMIVSTNLLSDESDEPLLDRCAKKLRDTVIVIPSKTIVHPAESKSATHNKVDEENNKYATKSPAKKKAKKTNSTTSRTSPANKVPLRLGVRDSAEKDKGGSGSGSQVNGSQQSKKPEPKPGKKCRRRLIPIAPGQKSITSFFRV